MLASVPGLTASVSCDYRYLCIDPYLENGSGNGNRNGDGLFMFDRDQTVPTIPADSDFWCGDITSLLELDDDELNPMDYVPAAAMSFHASLPISLASTSTTSTATPTATATAPTPTATTPTPVTDTAIATSTSTAPALLQSLPLPQIQLHSQSTGSTSYITPSSRWKALMTRDGLATSAFVYAVLTTKIYCRPDCKARLARRANVVFYATAAQAEKAGFRACKRCKPRRSRSQGFRLGCVTVNAGQLQPSSFGEQSDHSSRSTVAKTHLEAEPTLSTTWARDNGDTISDRAVSSRAETDHDTSRHVHAVASTVDNGTGTTISSSPRTVASRGHDHIDSAEASTESTDAGQCSISTETQQPNSTPVTEATPDCRQKSTTRDSDINPNPDTETDAETDPDPDDVRTKIHRAVHLVRDAASAGTTLSLSQLSKQVGLSKWHLQRVFKQLQGVTPREFAEQILANTEVSGTMATPRTVGSLTMATLRTVGYRKDRVSENACPDTSTSKDDECWESQMEMGVLSGEERSATSSATFAPSILVSGNEREELTSSRPGHWETLVPDGSLDMTLAVDRDMDMNTDPNLAADSNLNVHMDQDVEDLLGDLFPELYDYP
ncbi:hypothetical protein A1O1_05421 [Capronia coronata CBS 617.96]|uniref:HTH araC/xylS-type domain-containing protein n=1 Tax=Capronia coronata CBS 617.96 TaxID=1182541 RepID=W9YGV5_9EURO|nr:uncharacterized protein A1O1_05421 [Capronia coronata CBS 617.96]EXJ88491.1 hypothetical protein A1O1_05421 [Capronia coronata CBS 617.96]